MGLLIDFKLTFKLTSNVINNLKDLKAIKEIFTKIENNSLKELKEIIDITRRI